MVNDIIYLFLKQIESFYVEDFLGEFINTLTSFDNFYKFPVKEWGKIWVIHEGVY